MRVLIILENTCQTCCTWHHFCAVCDCNMQKSCKAYSFLEMDELKNGPVALEVYRKPPDFTRTKQPSLLSIKPLFLHLNLSIS